MASHDLLESSKPRRWTERIGLPAVAVYQCAGGALGIAATLLPLPALLENATVSIRPVVIRALALPVLLFAGSAIAGAALLLRRSGALRLSIVVQLLQVLWFASASLSYYFTAGLVLGIAGSATGVDPVARWGSVFVLSQEPYEGPFVIGINLLACALLLFLIEAMRRATRQQPK